MLKKFNVTLHPKAPQIIEVLWKPPPPLWVKCNTDGCSTDSSSSRGGLLRDQNSKFLLGFAENTENGSAFHAELYGAIKAIELAHQFQWSNIWLECDSALVIKAINNRSLVPWRLRNRWENCMRITNSINFLATHVFREGNRCAGTLAAIGMTLQHPRIWFSAPNCIVSSLARNKHGLPEFRFVNF